MGTLRLCVVLNRSVFIPSTRKRSDTDLTEGCLCLRLSRYWPWPAQPLLKSTAFMSQPRMKPGSSSLTQPAVPDTFPARSSHTYRCHCLPGLCQHRHRGLLLQQKWIPRWTQHCLMDLHAPGCLREVRLQRLGLPEEAHLRGHEGARILRSCCPEVQDWIPVRQVPRDLGPSRRHEGAPR